MARVSLTIGACAALGAAVCAQDATKHETTAFQPIVGRVEYAGVYHVATGTWTSALQGASLAGPAGQDIIYNNTAGGVFSATMAAGEIYTASGRVPSTSSPEVCWNPFAIPVGSSPGSARGCQDSYTIDGFQIGYCSQAPGNATTVQVAFYDSWFPTCSSSVTSGTPTGGPITLNNFPGVTAGNPSGCWVVDIDLTASGQTFSLAADGDGVYSANTDDAFAWTITFPSIVPGQSAGPIIAGCPVDGTGPAHPGHGWPNEPAGVTVENGGYDGTRFDRHTTPCPTNVEYPLNGAVGLPTPGGEAGTDAVGDDGFRNEGGTPPAPGVPGCFFFGGPLGSGGANDGPYSNFHLELFSSVFCAPPPPGDAFCFGDGADPFVTTACPCGNFGALGNGCRSSFNPLGAHLEASGQTANDDVALLGTGMNPNGIAIFVKGDSQQTSGLIYGDGITCLDGNLIRLRQKPLAGGDAMFPDSTDTVTLSVRGGTPPGSGAFATYLVYYRNASTTFCTAATYNTANTYRIVW